MSRPEVVARLKTFAISIRDQTSAQVTNVEARPPITVDPRLASRPADVKTTEPVVAPVPDVPVVAVEPDVTAAPEPVSAAEPVVDDADAEFPALRFFELVAGFLRNVAQGFESGPAREGDSFRYFYSQSFKLEMLKSVFELAAPEGGDDTARAASSLIDSANDD